MPAARGMQHRVQGDGHTVAQNGDVQDWEDHAGLLFRVRGRLCGLRAGLARQLVRQLARWLARCWLGPGLGIMRPGLAVNKGGHVDGLLLGQAGGGLGHEAPDEGRESAHAVHARAVVVGVLAPHGGGDGRALAFGAVAARAHVLVNGFAGGEVGLVVLGHLRLGQADPGHLRVDGNALGNPLIIGGQCLHAYRAYRASRDSLASRAALRLASRLVFVVALASCQGQKHKLEHGAMRELEVLKDRLLAWFAADPSLTPADVAVLTPDINGYAPYIDAVFGQRSDAPNIPYSIADRRIEREVPLLANLAALLDLLDSRFAADEVLSLLDCPALLRRFDLTAQDLPSVQGWVRLAAIRWGRDAAHKQQLGLPADASFTWRWGLDRLLLGSVLPAAMAESNSPLFDDLLPLSLAGGSQLELLMRFCAFYHGLADCVALLTYSHRFSAESGISALSQQVNAGHADAALETLQQGNYPDLGYSEQVDAELLFQNRENYWQAARDLADLNLVQQAFVAFMPLVSERRQVEQINRIVEQRLERDGLKPVGQLWYPGRPVMITTNDYGLDLFNGDIGFTRMCSDGLRVAFPLADGGWRELAPGRLPAHDTVYAMTVHKSQGSEFSETWLVLPEGGSALLDRALVYTAITRARTQFRICGSLATLYAAIGHAPSRFSGLARRLQA